MGQNPAAPWEKGGALSAERWANSARQQSEKALEGVTAPR